MHEAPETPRTRVITPALLAILLIAAARADASTLGLIGQARTGHQTLRQLSSLARVVQRLVEVASDRDLVDGSVTSAFYAADVRQPVFATRALDTRPDHRLRDELLSLPPPR